MPKNLNTTLHPFKVNDFTMCSKCKVQIPTMETAYIVQIKIKSPSGDSDRIIKTAVICENCKKRSI